MSGEKFNDVGHMLEKMQAFVEQTEATLQSSRDKVENLREQYQSLTEKGSEVQQSLAEIKQQAEEVLSPTELEAPAVSLTSEARPKPQNRVLTPQQDDQPLKQTSTTHESTDRSYLRK